MNPLHDSDVARQQARIWSERLGRQAARLPTMRPDAVLTQLDAIPPFAFSTSLPAILDHLRQRRERQEHAADKLRASEFMTGQ